VAWGQASAEVAGDGADEPMTVDVDATLIVAHSGDKDGAAKTYQRTRTGRDRWRIATEIPPTTSHTPALGGIGGASRPESRPPPAAPRHWAG